MPFNSRLRSRLLEARTAARMARHLPQLFPGMRASGAQLLARNSAELSHETALLFEGERYSWRDFDVQASAFAKLFAARGIKAGDAVAILLDNRPEYFFALLGLSKLCAVAACLNTHLSGAPLAHAVRLGKPRLALVGTEHEARFTDAFDDGDGMPPVALLSDRHTGGTAPTVDAALDSPH